jgi:hypothetical protein
MGLAGAVLLITGLVYAVIGIKNKWCVHYKSDLLLRLLTLHRIYVFGSAAYLTALAVVVLIVYLMNPPVSNGVQGAFFVAAFITGCIFGVLALVFADITEGFGCLLGGFCLSMWFLSLKSGGLIGSSTGRAIFIGCMSAGGYSLSFSHYTRNYGLIASISFSGATAAILGIDCLARSGWKEFWLYLWSLNDDIFPLNTNTYPLTKNIKAELAGVVIISVFGIVSQLRVWNMVKERREKSAAQELERQQEKDREEEERGRTVEDKFQKERAQWEATYGNKSIPDSSVRSSSIASPKGSTSIREKEVYGKDSVEMVNLSKSGVASEGTTVTVSVLHDDDIQQIDAQGNPMPNQSTSPPSEVSESASIPTKQPSMTKRASMRTAVPPPPPIVPLPFTVPNGNDAQSESDDNASVSAVPESLDEVAPKHRHMSKRISDMSATRHFSSNRASRVFSESSEALVDNDRSSSIAATLDNDRDDISLRQISPPQSPIGTEHFTDRETLASKDETKTEGSDGEMVDTSKRPQFRQSLTTSTDPKSGDAQAKRSSRRDSRLRADTLMTGTKSGSEQGEPSRSVTPAGSQAGQTESHVGSIREQGMPEKLSKVALSYRTNEWAKHLEAAERPVLDELPVPASPAVALEEVPEEKAVPVSDEIAAPLMRNKRESKRVSSDSRIYHPNGLGLDRSASTFSQNSLLEHRNITQPSPIASSGVLSRSNSSAHLDALAPLPSNTLLGQRETLMRKRTSSQSFTPGSSAANLLEQADQENMSLAQRRQILQHHQSTSPLPTRQQSSSSLRKSPPSTSQKWAAKPWAAPTVPTDFNSHPPLRTRNSQSDAKREELYAGWRGTMRDVTPPQAQAYIVEQQRMALLNERRQKEAEKQAREAAQMQRASMLDSMMRSGQMLDAHREAMRKMQGKANRKVT